MNLPEEIAAFNREMWQNLKEAPAKISTHITGRREGKHNHFPQGKTEFVPKGCSNPVNIRTALDIINNTGGKL